MKARRLIALAKRLRSVPRKKFTMELFAEEHFSPNPECGTAACAAGWATTIPSLRRAGLRLGNRETDWASIIFPNCDSTDEALGKCFGLNEREVDRLFYGRQCTPIAKAKQIEKFVAGKP